MNKENSNECECAQSEKNLRINDEPGTFKRDAEREKDEDGPELRGHRQGSFYVVNISGQTFKKITVRHRIGNNPNAITAEETFYDLKDHHVSNVVDFVYLTGFATPYDYWFIDLELISGYKYKTKDNFYCSVSHTDNGMVTIAIYSDLEAHFTFSKSSGCKVHLRGPY